MTVIDCLGFVVVMVFSFPIDGCVLCVLSRDFWLVCGEIFVSRKHSKMMHSTEIAESYVNTKNSSFPYLIELASNYSFLSISSTNPIQTELTLKIVSNDSLCIGDTIYKCMKTSHLQTRSSIVYCAYKLSV